MYRPNRIGPWPIADTDKTKREISYAAFTGSGSAILDHGCVVPNVVLGEDFIQEVIWSSTNPNLGSAASQGIGVAISGVNTHKNYIYGLSGECSFRVANPDGITLAAVFGRSIGAVDAVNPTSVITPILLPVKSHSYSDSGAINIMASFDTVVVTQQKVDDQGSNLDPLMLFWRIGNVGGSAQDIIYWNMRLSMQRYAGDFLTFEPNR